MADELWEVAVIGAGMAGLSAAIYLGRMRRRAVFIDSGHSMAEWEPHVENYLGFPDGISGEQLLRRGRHQAEQYDVKFISDIVDRAHGSRGDFLAEGRHGNYRARRLLIATGIFHIPPEIPELDACLGHSMFFCKDCDGYRVRNKKVGIVGASDEAVEYALEMLTYTPQVSVLTNGKRSAWDEQHAAYLSEFEIPLFEEKIEGVDQNEGIIHALRLEDGRKLPIQVLFTVRGDIVHNRLAKSLGLELSTVGEIVVDKDLKTSLPGVYAAGCVTPANCQMIIAAGQGAAAAQTINRDLFEESLHNHSLLRAREEQLRLVPSSAGPEFGGASFGG